jgi:hypothetical protein
MASLQPSVGKETRWLECSKCLVFFFFLKMLVQRFVGHDLPRKWRAFYRQGTCFEMCVQVLKRGLVSLETLLHPSLVIELRFREEAWRWRRHVVVEVGSSAGGGVRR